jgi:hypothetical protein
VPEAITLSAAGAAFYYSYNFLRFKRLEMHNAKKTVLAVAITSMLPFAFYLGQAQAHTSVMNFDNPAMPAAVFGGLGQPYVQSGFEHTSIDFNSGTNTSSVNGADSGGSRVSQLGADAGGALFRSATPGEHFAFGSWEMTTLNTAIDGGGDSVLHVVGLRDGVTVADVSLTHAEDGNTIQFFSMDNDFGNVDQVEYWFDAPGRGENPVFGIGLQNLLAEVDEVNFGDAIPVVPEPETYAMLLVGLGLVGFAAHRRRTYY